LDQADKQSCDIIEEVELEYNDELQDRLTDMAFSKISESWYKDGNKVTNNWAGGTREYVKRLKKIDMSLYAIK